MGDGKRSRSPAADRVPGLKGGLAVRSGNQVGTIGRGDETGARWRSGAAADTWAVVRGCPAAPRKGIGCAWLSLLIMVGLPWASPHVAGADAGQVLRVVDMEVDARAQNVMEYVEHAVDPGGQVHWMQVVQDGPLSFEPVQKSNLGLNRDYHWLRYRIRNASADAIHGVIEMHRSYNVLEADVYLLAGEELERHWSLGMSEGGGEAPLALPQIAFPIDLPPGAERTVLTRMRGGIFYLRAEPRVWEEQAFFAQSQKAMGIGWGFHGLMLVLALYNLVLFWAIRDRVYAWYVAWTLAALAMNSSRSGMASLLIPTDLYEWLWRPVPFLMLASVTQFTRLLLETKDHSPRLDRILRYEFRITGVWVLGSFVLPNMVSEIGFRALAAPLIGSWLYAGYLSVKEGVPPAKIYLSTYAVQFAGIGINVFAMLGAMPANLFTTNVNRIGVSLQMILFALALAQRYSVMRNRLAREQTDRLAAQAEALQVKEEAASNLQRKVDERTAELSQKNIDLARVNNDLSLLFNNMHQGVLAFDSGGKVVGRASRQAELIFERDDLAGCDVYHLLYANVDEFDLSNQVFLWWREAVFSCGVDAWKEQEAMAPREVVMHPGSDRERHLALEYDPIIEAGELALVMMLVTDRTEQVLLERAAAEREQAHARQLERMRRMAAGGGQMFVGFLRGAAQRFAEIRDLLESKQGQLAQVDVEFLFRHAHTVKGEARTYDLEDLGAACHRLEDRLQELRSQAEATGEVDASPCIGELKVNLDACSGKLDAARGTLIEASPIGAAILEQVTVQRSDVQRLQQCLSTLEAEKGELDPSLREVASRLASRPLGELAAGISDNADRWARGLGKRVVLQVRGRDCLIPPELARVLPGALTHLIRNAVDHAVEKPEAREAVGKDDFGSIVVEGRQGSCGPIISVRDDGRGIDAERLRSKAEARGIPYTAGSEVELIFSDGMSTRDEVSDLSGRGVGMSAVKAELGDVGYAIAIATEPGKGTTFCLRSVHATGETDFPEELQAVS